MSGSPRVVILGGGPAGYEAALVAAQAGASVTLVERDGLGGAAVLTDCVPSKALIATSATLAQLDAMTQVGVQVGPCRFGLGDVNRRILDLARAQSEDVRRGLERAGVSLETGAGRLTGPRRVAWRSAGGERELDADIILLATGARPRPLDGAAPDGERILTWRQLFALDDLPEHLVVVGSGVTGAEFACGYLALGSQVTLVSSRDRVLPAEDADAAAVIERVFARDGGVVRPHSRAIACRRDGAGVVVVLADGQEVRGSHALVAIGSLPNTEALGVTHAGVAVDDRGFVKVDRVSRTTVPGIYAAGDCTGVLMLASVAAMQGRIAMWHALGETVAPLDLAAVSATVFTRPEIATVGDRSAGRAILLPLRTNARAKMESVEDGFVKLHAVGRTVTGGVVCSPHASELIHPIALAVAARLTLDEVATTFTVYPSLSGSIAEAARRLRSTAG
jgi:pyruvate/2-oxoglutarate dehydrogenase complex dihydrolipoamide dehydrogenase (E3) component